MRKCTALLLVVLLGTTACGAAGDADGAGGGAGARTDASTGAAPSRGGTLTVGLGTDIVGWTPADNQWTPGALTMARAVYDPLAAFTVDGEVEPYLAAAIEPSDDFRSWTIALREDVTFHDGLALDADIVVANLEAIRSSPLLGDMVARIDAVEAIDPREVRVTMSAPWATFDVALAVQSGFIVHPDLLDGAVVDPIGTGPFVVDEWLRGSRLTASANPDYWRAGLPLLDRVEFVLIPDDITRRQALDAGTIDMLHTADPLELVAQRDVARADDGLQVISDGGADDVSFALLNTQSGPTADLEVRRALQLATDRDRLNDELFEGALEVVDSPYTSTSRWWTDPGWPDPDPAAAARMIADWEDANGPLQIEVSTLPAPDLLRTAQYLAGEWEDVGIDISVTTLGETPFVLSMVTGTYEVAVLALFNAPDPAADSAFYHPDNIAPRGDFGLSLPRLESAVLDDTLDAASQTADPDERQALYAEVWRELAGQVPFLWLVEHPWIFEADAHVGGLESFTLPEGDSDPLLVAWGSIWLTHTWIDD